MKKGKKTLSKNYIIVIAIIVFILIFTPTIVQAFYRMGENQKITLSKGFYPAEILTYIGTVLAFLGTIILGALTLHQNNRLHELNEENNKIQKLLAQEYMPFIELSEISVEDVIELPSENFNQNGTSGVNNTIRPTGTVYQIVVYNKTNNWARRYKKEASFFLKNSSKAKIQSIEFVDLKLDKVKINEHGNLTKTLNYVINLKSTKTFLLLPEENINCRLQIFFDDENYYEVVQNNQTFEFELSLKITTITGIAYKETIKYSNYYGVEPEIQYVLT